MSSNLYFNITRLGPVITNEYTDPIPHGLSFTIQFKDGYIDYIMVTVNHDEENSYDTSWLYPRGIKESKDMKYMMGLSTYLGVVNLSIKDPDIVPSSISPIVLRDATHALDPNIMVYVANALHNTQIFLFYAVNHLLLNFVRDFRQLFKVTMKTNLNVHDAADEAIEEINRKLHESLEDIEYATSKLSTVSQKVALDLKQTVDEQITSFNQQIDAYVTERVSHQMKTNVDPRIAEFDNKVSQLNNKLDRIIKYLNIH